MTAEAASEEEPSLESLSRRSTLWTVVGYGSSQGIRLAGSLILTRLLAEEAFGIMALAGAVMTGLHLFSDLGTGPAIIQNKRGEDPTFLDTAWTMQTVRGVALGIFALLLSPIMAHAYNEPQLQLIMPAVAFTALIEGLNSTRIFTQNRRLSIGRTTLMELSAQLTGFLVTVAIGYIYRTIWALVLGGIAAASMTLLLSHTLLPGHRNRFAWDSSAAKQLVTFGRWIFLSTIMTFLADQADRLIFGKLLQEGEGSSGLGVLGVYSVAMVLAQMPQAALARLSQIVIYPVFSRVHNEGKGLREVFRIARHPYLCVGAWACAGLLAGGPTMVRLLYDPRYYQGGVMIRYAALGTWCFILHLPYGAAATALGRTHWSFIFGITKVLGMVIAIPLGYWLGGFMGAILGYASTEVFRYGMSLFAAGKCGVAEWRVDVMFSSLLAVAAVVGYAAAEAVRMKTDIVIIEALAVFVTVSAVFLPVMGPIIKNQIERVRANRASRVAA